MGIENIWGCKSPNKKAQLGNSAKKLLSNVLVEFQKSFMPGKSLEKIFLKTEKFEESIITEAATTELL